VNQNLDIKIHPEKTQVFFEQEVQNGKHKPCLKAQRHYVDGKNSRQIKYTVYKGIFKQKNGTVGY
jgi:hypothetical protein